MVLIDRKTEVQQFQLSIISIEQISSSGTVLSGTSHILAQPIQRGAFLRISLRIVAIGLSDIGLERLNPIDFAGLLEGRRYHRRLHHLDGARR